jgi:hypothetical protein
MAELSGSDSESVGIALAADAPLTPAEHSALRFVATILLPGDVQTPAATDLPDLDANLDRALAALGTRAQTCRLALGELPERLDWDGLRDWSTAQPELFEALALLVSGAYFMSPTALDAIGYPHGPRRRAPHDLAAEELGSGVLDPMLARASMVREVPA